MLNVVMLNVDNNQFMLCVIMLSVVMLSGIMLNGMAPLKQFDQAQNKPPPPENFLKIYSQAPS
jgi:hypothetical protein